MSQYLEEARKYLGLGLSVFPVARADKRPKIKWGEYQSHLPAPENIADWWGKWPRASIGLACGKLSDDVVIDFDGPHAWEWWMEQHEAAGEAMAPAPRVLTSWMDGNGSGPFRKFQQHYRHPGFKVSNAAKKLGEIVTPEMDVRGDGGFCILPPSVHPSGAVYEWAPDSPAWEDRPPLPKWFLQVLEERTRAPEPQAPPDGLPFQAGEVENRPYIEAAVRRELDVLASAPIGRQNEQLNESAFKLGTLVGAGALSRADAEAEIERVVLSWPNAPGRPPWTRENMRDTMQSGLEAGEKRPRNIPAPPKRAMLRGKAVRAWVGKKSAAEVEGAAEEEESEEVEAGEGEGSRAGSYRLSGGRTYLIIEKASTGKDNTQSKNEHFGVVWDGAAHIAEEITDEDGQTIYKIEGRTKQGRQFNLELEASKTADPKAMLAALANVAGANCVFAAGMEKHLAPSIRSFTSTETLEYGRRFKRVGWLETPTGLEFLIPGRESERTAIILDRKLPYELHAEAELMQGLSVLDQLFQAQRVEMTSVAIAALLQAPLARLAGWQDERYALFISGRTGSLKTSWTMQGMAMYGPGFGLEERLIKFGQGATNNSIMQHMTRASDVPFLVDNYKPGTGGGAKDIINLIHASLEGGEKDRLNRDATQRASKAIHTWPVFTGEDVPDTDAASMARVLVVPFTWQGGRDNAPLTFVQDNVLHMCAIGRAWIDWLCTPEAKAEAKRAARDFHATRSKWSKYLRERRSEMVNISRVASNLATNELAWRTALACPALVHILRKYIQAHAAGLQQVADGMALYASESSEGARYLEAIRSLITTKRVLLVPRTQDFPEEVKGKYLGWEDARGVYLVPEVAYQEAAQLLKENGGFNGVSKNTIHKQLAQANVLASEGKDGPVSVWKCGAGNKAQRVLHIKPEAIYPEVESQEEDDE